MSQREGGTADAETGYLLCDPGYWFHGELARNFSLIRHSVGNGCIAIGGDNPLGLRARNNRKFGLGFFGAKQCCRKQDGEANNDVFEQIQFIHICIPTLLLDDVSLIA